MAQARLPVRKIREVLRLKYELRLSDRKIAAALGSARSTVQECVRICHRVWPCGGQKSNPKPQYDVQMHRWRRAGRDPIASCRSH